MLGGGAFGAGLIQLGTPAKLPFSLDGNPREGSGALVPGTVRLLPIAAPDPAGGPDWGMRELSTSRGEGCLQLGRIVDGKLGALGQDDAFANDGRFHELPVSAALDFDGCALLDGDGRLFTNVTADERAASAWIGTGGRLGGCVPPSAGPYEKGLRLTRQEREHGSKPAPLCPQADLRNIYYGLLRPEAQSFIARLPVTDARRSYDIAWREPGMAPGVHGGESTNSDIAAGQTVTRTIGEYGPSVRAGVVHGSVTLRQALGPGGIEGPGSVAVTVGSFTVRVP